MLCSHQDARLVAGHRAAIVMRPDNCSVLLVVVSTAVFLAHHDLSIRTPCPRTVKTPQQGQYKTDLISYNFGRAAHSDVRHSIHASAEVYAMDFGVREEEELIAPSTTQELPLGEPSC